jgi:DNA-binding response OmpR family regulator
MRFTGTILLAEDNTGDAVLIEWALTKAGFDNPLEVVEDGKEVIRYLAGEGRFGNRENFPLPSLLLLDLHLPKIDGLEVLKWIRNSRHLPGFPVIVLTGAPNQYSNDLALELGAASCLNKPLGFAELARDIQTHLKACFPAQTLEAA